jgi:glycosyltransferase involved in cell wall biosynthesis
MVRGADPVTVTVVTATRNSSKTLYLTLKSILNQTFGDFEAWIIGDACTDESQAVVEAFGDDRLHWKNLELNSGSQAVPNNEALRLARGRYIAYLGHDDLWLPHHLSGLVQCIEERGADLVHSLCAEIGPEGVRESIGPPRRADTYQWHFVPPSTWLHRRELIEACGFWKDPDQLRWPVDFDFLHSVFLAGKTIAFHPRLSVLKFPSAWFRMYSHVGEPPQLEYWQRLRADPEALERQVLLDLSTEFARQRCNGAEPLSSAVSNLARALLRRVKPVYYSQVFAILARRRFQGIRAESRLKRGLPPQPR